MALLKLETVSLKQHEELDEKWVQKQLADDPTLLGLGDMVLKDKERTQPHAGRLDLLLQDPETLKRYEVEIQLGATDESHIIRTVEYWDIERKRYPQYEHAAVIVAEDITSRFLNVIQLFNGAIPLIALKMTAYKVGDQYALTFVKILDEQTYGLVGEDEPLAEVTNRPYWEAKASKESLLTTDQLLKLVHEVEPNAVLRYNKHYIGLEVNGLARNFVSFIPRKSWVIMSFKLPPQAEETNIKLEEADIASVAYDSQFGQYRIRIKAVVEKQQQALIGLIRQAADKYGKA
jgi:predicted transport protein